MRSARRGALLVALACLLSFPGAVRAADWERTEARAPCANVVETRRPLFGDLHVHTGYSQDAMLVGVRATPADAYRFAKGGAIDLPGGLGSPGASRSHRLRHPLDFAAVTDHAEYLGPVGICLNPGATGYEAKACRAARDEWNPWWVPTRLLKRLSVLRGEAWTSYLGETPSHSPICAEHGVDCPGATADRWQDVRAAAEAAYDRTAACTFTTFVGYEFSAAPDNGNLHRNVIFRNADVPPLPFSAIDADNDPAKLWTHLRTACRERDGACDVLAIPHNSNLSLGRMFADPADADEAALRAELEPLVEVYQHKGSSECHPDAGGLGPTDESCGFERIGMTSLKIGLFQDEEVPRRAYVRTALQEGLRLGRELGVNPFRLGLIGSTDNHNGAAGDTDEEGWPGAFGSIDADPDDWPANRMSGAYATFSPGGLAVVWAEENSRDAIFAALRRRETYATSGTRPVVRFFGGWDLPDSMCDARDFAAHGYADGVPMGGTLHGKGAEGAPRLAIRARKDGNGADLARIEIVKGWLDADGQSREAVHVVAGASTDDAPGAVELCTVWEDAAFDPDAPAFYYVRVLERPTPRWTTLQCRAAGIDPLADPGTCRAQVGEAQGLVARWLTGCCADDDGTYEVPPFIQERAWTSPIWFQPRADRSARVVAD